MLLSLLFTNSVIFFISTPTSGTAQGTLPKGFSRTARTGHLLSNASGNDIDEPRILPDRHSKVSWRCNADLKNCASSEIC